MPKTTKVSQKKWIKGVNAAAMPFAQPQGSFPRVSNLIYVHRGSLYTCDGSLLLSAFNGSVQPITVNFGPITEIFLYEPIGADNEYFALIKDYNTHLGAPTGLVAVDGGAGGTLSAGTYHWQVTALDGAGGETTVSNDQSLALAANHKANLNWTSVTFATGYNVYRTLSGGATKFLVNTSGPVTTNSYVDNIPDGSLGTKQPPTTDTTQVTQFYAIPGVSYTTTDIVKTFPADLPPLIDGTEGGFGGGGTGGHSGNKPPTPAGGISGNVSPIPQILQFRNLMILILGNGLTPYQSDGTTPNTIALVNNFQASYGARAASTLQSVGDQISVNIAGVNYIFTCYQAGTTGAGGPPAFSAVERSIVVDGTVYWQNTGKVAASTPPRGAAHAIVYAGSLWIGNTSPTSTTDNFDGPSCLKMSDLNNPNSWNPLNVAFLDRDDGTQITGMATFTIAESGIPPVGSLVVFKDFSTFQINGVFGASNFSIARAQTDMGCVAGRTVLFVPGFGIVRLTHLGIAMFDGVRDRLLSEEIRPYIFGGQPDIQPADWNYIWNSKAAMTSIPPMYCCAIPTYIPEGTLVGPVVSAVPLGASAGPNLAGTGASTGVGLAWTNPGNVSSAVAYANMHRTGTVGGNLQFLQATNFGFAVGGGTNFTGITITFEAFLGIAFPEDLSVTLLKNGVAVGTSKLISLSTVLNTYTLGGASDLWGDTWIGSDFNNANFGVQFQILASSVALDINVRNVQVTLGSPMALPDGDYFFKVVKYKTNGNRTVTAEQGPFTLGPISGNGFQVTVPSPSANDLKYRVYFGIGQGAEAQYQEFPATQLTYVSSTPGLAGQATSSNGELTRLLCYDLVLKAWTIIDLPFSIYTLRQFRTIGSIPITVLGGFYDSGIRRWLGGAGLDTTWDAGSSIPDVQWSVRTPEVFGKEASDRVYFREIVIRGRVTPNVIYAQTTINGISATRQTLRPLTVTPMGGGQFIAYFDVGITGTNGYMDLTGTGPTEVQSIDWMAVAKAISGKVMV